MISLSLLHMPVNDRYMFVSQESLDEQQLQRLAYDLSKKADLVSASEAIGDNLAAPAPKG
jgi:hypothetical protein